MVAPLSQSHLDTLGVQRLFELRYLDIAAVKYARGKRRVYLSVAKGAGEVLHGAGTARGHQGHRAQRAHQPQLLDVIAVTGAVGGHAIEHDLPRAAALHLADPLQRVALAVAAARRIAGVLIDAIA